MRSSDIQGEMSSMHLTGAGPELRREVWAGDETLTSSAHGGGMLSPGAESGIQVERTARDQVLRPGGGREAHTDPERAQPRKQEGNEKCEGRWTPREEMGTCHKHSCGVKGGEDEQSW